jgi:hypothetical protein
MENSENRVSVFNFKPARTAGSENSIFPNYQRFEKVAGLSTFPQVR